MPDAVPPPPLSRRLALFAGLTLLPALAGCGGEAPAPQVFAPLDFSYLTKLRLNVARIDIDDTWTPRADSGEHVEYLSPVQPIDALRDMARERLVAAGSNGRARFLIQDASIVRQPDSLYGSFAVRLEVSRDETASGGGTSSGFAEARVARSEPVDPDAADGGRAAAYALVKQMMDTMNVEFEYQVRRSLRGWLQATSGSAPAPAPVQAQPLPPPPGVGQAPALVQPGS